MAKIILSINPQHVENIFSGIKKYEYRKIKCKKEINKIIIYSTSPVMKIVGEAEVDYIVEGRPDDVWKKTKEYSGINIEFYREYYNNKDMAIAYKLKNVKKYDKQIDIKKYGVKAPPQSYVYI